MAVKSKRWDQQISKKSSPAVEMNWYTALAFSRWLSSNTDSIIRLPTENEWKSFYKIGRDYFGNIGEWCLNEADDTIIVDYSSGAWKPILGSSFIEKFDGVNIPRMEASPINTFAFVGFRILKEIS